MQVVDEGCSKKLTASFTNASGNPLTLESGTYQIHDGDTGAEVRAAENLPALESTIEITLTASDNSILDGHKEHETRVLTIKAVYGGGQPLNAKFSWMVRNLTAA